MSLSTSFNPSLGHESSKLLMESESASSFASIVSDIVSATMPLLTDAASRMPMLSDSVVLVRVVVVSKIVFETVNFPPLVDVAIASPITVAKA